MQDPPVAGCGDSYIPNARADNAIAYRGRFGGLTLGATWSFGRDAVNAGPSPGGTNCAGETPGNARPCRGGSALAKFDAAVGGVALAVDELRGGPGAFAGLASADKVDRRISASGYVTVGTIDNDGSLALSVSGGAPGSSPVAGGSQQGVMVGVRHAF